MVIGAVVLVGAQRTYVKLSVGVLAMGSHEATVVVSIPGIARFPISLTVMVLPILLVHVLVVVVVLRVRFVWPDVTV